MSEYTSCCGSLRKNKLWVYKTLTLYYLIRSQFSTNGDPWTQMDANVPRTDSPTINNMVGPSSREGLLCVICHKERIPCETGGDPRCVRCTSLSTKEGAKEDTSEKPDGPGKRKKPPRRKAQAADPDAAALSAQRAQTRKRQKVKLVKRDSPVPSVQQKLPPPPGPTSVPTAFATPAKSAEMPGTTEIAAPAPSAPAEASSKNARSSTPAALAEASQPASAGKSAESLPEQPGNPVVRPVAALSVPMNNIYPNVTSHPASADKSTASLPKQPVSPVVRPVAALSVPMKNNNPNVTYPLASFSLTARTEFNITASHAFSPTDNLNDPSPHISAVTASASNVGAPAPMLTAQLSTTCTVGGSINTWNTFLPDDPIGDYGTFNGVGTSSGTATQNPSSHFSSPDQSNSSVSSSSSGATSTAATNGSAPTYGGVAESVFSFDPSAVTAWLSPPGGATSDATGFLHPETSSGSMVNTGPFKFGDCSDTLLAASSVPQQGNDDTAPGEFTESLADMSYGNTGFWASSSELYWGSGPSEPGNTTGRLRCTKPGCDVTFDTFDSVRVHYEECHANDKAN